MGYPQINNAEVEKKDLWGQGSAIKVGELLQKFSRNLITDFITQGASGVTVTNQIFCAPAKMVVTKASVLVNTPNVGASNEVTVNLKNGSTVIATGTIELGLAAGDVVELTLNATSSNLVLDINDVLSLEVVTATATVDTALVSRTQVEYYLNNN